VAKTKAPSGFEHIHYMLGGPLREVERAHWPARPHLGGPVPVISYVAQLRVGREIAAHARVLAPPPDLAPFDQLVELVESTAPDIPRAELDRATAAKKTDPLGTKVARLVARGVYNFRFAAASAANTTGKCITNAAVALVGGIDVDEASRFLQALDDAILVNELRDRLDDRKIVPSSRLGRVLSRPRATPTAKTCGVVLASLADGTYGLLVKLKNTWQWHEGDRATVFATVPDAYMAEVAADLDG